MIEWEWKLIDVGWRWIVSQTSANTRMSKSGNKENSVDETRKKNYPEFKLRLS